MVAQSCEGPRRTGNTERLCLLLLVSDAIALPQIANCYRPRVIMTIVLLLGPQRVKLSRAYVESTLSGVCWCAEVLFNSRWEFGPLRLEALEAFIACLIEVAWSRCFG